MRIESRTSDLSRLLQDADQLVSERVQGVRANPAPFETDPGPVVRHQVLRDVFDEAVDVGEGGHAGYYQ
jgi:hypothetical protein